MYSKKKLENEATCIIAPQSATEAVTVLVMFPVGSRYETPELNGVAHFIEHMMFKGTTRRPNTLALSRALDAVGAEYNAYTSKDYTGYYVHIDHRHLELALDIVSDMLWESLFDAQEIDREKGVIAEELHMYEDNPLMHIDEFLEETMFFGSSLGWKIGGTPEIISKFTREQMVEFRDNHYVPKKMCVTVAGNVPQDIEQKVAQYFGGAHRSNVAAPQFSTHVEVKNASRVSLKWKETEQAVVALGCPAYSYMDSRVPALMLLHVILGGTMSSRLFIEVRERRGLAYVVRTDVSSYHETGMMSVHMGLLPSRIEEALKVVKEELQKIAAGGVTVEELQHAKDNVRGKMALSLERCEEVAQWYAKQWTLKTEVETPEERMAKIDAVTNDALAAVAKDIFGNPKFRLAVIGPYKDTTPFEKFV